VKKAIDIIQLLLTDLGPFSFLMAVILAWALFQAGKVAGFLLQACVLAAKAIRAVSFNPFTIHNGALVLLVGSIIYLKGDTVTTGLQYIEQRISPTYITNDTSFFAESRFEDVIKRHTNEAQFLTVRDSTRALAKEIGCRPQDIYLVAYSECGLNPFTVRTDGIAAGWIQFTRAGVKGLGRSLEDVKAACSAKDAVEVMRLTGAYIRRAAAGRKVETAQDFYCAVFAPAKMGAGMDDALYSGFSNPEYYLNAGLDGYFLESGKVLYLPHLKDGKLTKRDLMAALEYKKAKFLK
jgi:hypothetical protein